MRSLTLELLANRSTATDVMESQSMKEKIELLEKQICGDVTFPSRGARVRHVPVGKK
jgi:hypothetical protein